MVRRIPTLMKSILTAAVLTLMGFLVSSQIADAQTLAYVANIGSNTVSVINTVSNSVVTTLNVGSQANGIAITPDGTRAYVTNGGGAVWVLATAGNTVLAKVSLGGYPTAVAITPDGTRVIGDSGENTIMVWAAPK